MRHHLNGEGLQEARLPEAIFSQFLFILINGRKPSKCLPKVGWDLLLVAEEAAEHPQQQGGFAKLSEAVFQLLEEGVPLFAPQVLLHELLHLRGREGFHLQLFLDAQIDADVQRSRGENHRRSGAVAFPEILHGPPQTWSGQLVDAVEQQQELSPLQEFLQRLQAKA